MINLSNALFQNQSEVLTIFSELDKTLQPTYFVPQQEKAAKVQELTQLSGSSILKSEQII